jgi:hypothetical protein
MKRATFKKPFNGMDNALKLIPESYKVDGNEFEITDGIETYSIRWESDINEGTVLRAENKNLISEDMQKIKHLMGFKSQDTLGTLKGKERISENASFRDVWDKTHKLLNESEEEIEGEVLNESTGHAAGMGFSNEGNLEGNTPIAEMERELDEEVNEGALCEGCKCEPCECATNESAEEVTEGGDDVNNFMDAMGHNQKLNNLASKINTRDEKVEAALDFVRDLTGGDEAITAKVARLLMKGDVTADAGEAAMAGNMNESYLNEGGSDINKVIMFGFNYPHDFIEKVWGDDPRMANHFKSKFSSIYERHGASAAFFKFYTELDGGNQAKIEDYIRNNYLGESEMAEECGDDYMEESDRFDEIFEGMYEDIDEEVNEELSPEQSDEMDTDKDGDIDAKDLKNLRDKK